MKRVLAAAAAAGLLSFGMAAPASADGPSVETYDLIAGGGNVESAQDIGDVTITDDGTDITVDITVDPAATYTEGNTNPILLHSVHIEANCEVTDFPLSKGNPVPGQFDFQWSYPDGVATFSETIPSIDCGDEDVLVAVHTDAKQADLLGGIDALNLAFPAEGVPVGYKVALDSGNDPDASYFDTTFTPLSGPLAGQKVNGWCVDIGHNISPGAPYTGTAYSIFNLPTGPVGNIDKPENLPYVLWLLNNYRPGDADPFVEGRVLTSGDIQRAIWYIVDNSQSTAGLGSFRDATAQALSAESFTRGTLVLPESLCDLVIPVIVIADSASVQSTIVQTTIAEFGIPCETIPGGSETAMALNTELIVPEKSNDRYGWQFPGRNWFGYVKV